MLKRYKDSELGESASRRVSYHCTTDYAKSSRANCRVCNTNILQKELRLALMLQDDVGYKSAAWTHFDCFWKHPEAKKLNGTHEIHNFSKLKPSDQKKISDEFDNLNAEKSTTGNSKKRDHFESNDDTDNDDEYQPVETKAGVSKRKRGSEK